MAGRSRLLIALTAALVIFSLIPHSNAESIKSSEVEIHINELNDYYIAGDTIMFFPTLFNPTDSIQIHNDFSCDYIFEVFTKDSVLVFSSENKCVNQVQTLELTKGQHLQLMTHSWDFTDNDGFELNSGTYQITVKHSLLLISDYSTFEYHANSTIPNEIVIHHNIIDISNEYSSAYLIQAIIHNPTPVKLDVDGENCNILLENSIKRHIFSDCLNGISTIRPYENIYIGSLIIQSDWNNQLDEITIKFLGDYEYSIIQLLNPHYESFEHNPSNSMLDVPDFNYRIINEAGGSYLSIVTEHDKIKMSEIDNCLIDVYIVNDYGSIIVDEKIDICYLSSSGLSDPDKDHQYEVYRWNLTDEENCYVDFGKYTIVLGSKEFSSIDFFQNVPNTFTRCFTINPELDISNHLVDNIIYSSVKISGMETFRITYDCVSVVHVVVNSAQDDNITKMSCDYNIGSFFSPPNGIFEIDEKIELPEKLVEIKDISLNNLVYMEITQIHTDTFYLESGNLTTSPESTYAISGVWDLIQHEDEQCWVISSPNSASIVKENSLDSIWSPQQDWYGEYSVTEQQPDNGFCSKFGLPVVAVNNVFMELSPYIDNQPPIPINQDGYEVITITEIAVVGAASSSILLGLLIFISNTESLRIPVTSAGLWMLALVGKTHETSDGRFQRGRLIGYLTANPGCHFRGLMAALNMSNGQITHHLRLLENQELIWRISDGRFVRYYPLNNSLYPGMNPDDLPVPPLSPDPRSLQGKILTILDDEHQLGEFPTQAELAKKLEKSQQLISHHLRTLQKYGLVEKRKMGIKNRYKLTKEALFLLETDIEYLKVRD